jgi:hypothetical protein
VAVHPAGQQFGCVRITDRVVEKMHAWTSHQLEPVYRQAHSSLSPAAAAVWKLVRAWVAAASG